MSEELVVSLFIRPRRWRKQLFRNISDDLLTNTTLYPRSLRIRDNETSGMCPQWRYWLLWEVRQRRMVVSYRSFGKACRCNLDGLNRPREILHDIQEERTSHLHRGGGLQSVFNYLHNGSFTYFRNRLLPLQCTEDHGFHSSKH